MKNITFFQKIITEQIKLTEDDRLRLDLKPSEIPHLPKGDSALTPSTKAGWQTEAIKRAIISNLHMGADWTRLFIYGGSGQALRNWKAFYDTLEILDNLEENETLFMQSGIPYGVWITNKFAPRCVITNSIIVPNWTQEFAKLRQAGLTQYGQMTAGSWIFIGLQGILQGTYETIAEAIKVAEKANRIKNDFGEKLVVSGGLGLMSGAQPLAIKMSNKIALIAEVEEQQIDDLISKKYLDEKVKNIPDAIALAKKKASENSGYSIGVLANIVEVLEYLIKEKITPLVLTDQTSAHEISQTGKSAGKKGAVGYAPTGMTVEEILKLKETDPSEYIKRARATAIKHIKAMNALMNRGAETFDYGNNLRGEAKLGGLSHEEAFKFAGFVPNYIRPLFCEGKGPFRWSALSNDPEDIKITDDYAKQVFADDPQLKNWINLANEHVPFERGLPARVFWAGFGRRASFGMLLNKLYADKKIKAPVIIGRDHLDGGSVASPNRETEGMKDGSDAIGDYPVINLVGNALCGASWVSYHNGGGVGVGNSLHAGQVVVADGTPLAQEKLFRVLMFDPLCAILRHAHAGYDKAKELAKKYGLKNPDDFKIKQNYLKIYNELISLIKEKTGIELHKPNLDL